MSDIFTFEMNEQKPDFKYSKIKQYENYIRDELVKPVFTKYRIELEEKGIAATPIDEKMMKRFFFDKLDGRQYLISSLDILGDSETVITEFNKSKIENGNRNNTGECYMRVYGVLSAVYIQTQAIKTLSEIFKVSSNDVVKKQIEDSGIMFLRHIISAHPLNFSTDLIKRESFQLSRFSLTDWGDLQVRNHHGKFEDYKIFDLLKEYEQLAQLALHQIAIKVIDMLYRTNTERIPALEERLNKIKDAD